MRPCCLAGIDKVKIASDSSVVEIQYLAILFKHMVSKLVCLTKTGHVIGWSTQPWNNSQSAELCSNHKTGKANQIVRS